MRLFWYGTSNEKKAVVLGIVVPKQLNSWGHYELTAADGKPVDA
jgi:hypothetical protein